MFRIAEVGQVVKAALEGLSPSAAFVLVPGSPHREGETGEVVAFTFTVVLGYRTLRTAP